MSRVSRIAVSGDSLEIEFASNEGPTFAFGPLSKLFNLGDAVPRPAADPASPTKDSSNDRTDALHYFMQGKDINRGPRLNSISSLEWSPTLGGKRVKFAEAEKLVADLGPGWRMPTRMEWCYAIDDTRHAPALDPEKHPGVELGYHWTGTSCPWAPESAVFVVGTSYGYVYSGYGRSNDAFVRAVREVGGAGQ